MSLVDIWRSEVKLPEYPPRPAHGVASVGRFQCRHGTHDRNRFAKVDADRGDPARIANSDPPFGNLVQQRIERQGRVIVARRFAGNTGFRPHHVMQEIEAMTLQRGAESTGRVAAVRGRNVNVFNPPAVPVEVLAKHEIAIRAQAISRVTVQS